MVRPGFLFWHIGHALTQLACWAFLRVRTERPRGRLAGPMIWAGKHCSYWDIPIMCHAGWWVGGQRPCWEMASFVGYPVIGRLRWVLRGLGGFEVMRPKDLLRIRRLAGGDREAAAATMRSVNDAAAERRTAVIRAGAIYGFFPEGTRSRGAVGTFRSTHEIREACDLAAAEGLEVSVVPVAASYGPKPRFTIPFLLRRPVTLRILEPIAIRGRSSEEVLAEIEGALRAGWTPEPDAA